MIPRFRNYHNIVLDKVYCTGLTDTKSLNAADYIAYLNGLENEKKWHYGIYSTQRVAWRAAQDSRLRTVIRNGDSKKFRIFLIILFSILLWFDRNIHRL